MNVQGPPRLTLSPALCGPLFSKEGALRQGCLPSTRAAFPPAQPHASPQLFLSQQIDELLAGSLTPEDEDAVLEELRALTQVQGPSLSASTRGGAVGAPRGGRGWPLPQVSPAHGGRLRHPEARSLAPG